MRLVVLVFLALMSFGAVAMAAGAEGAEPAQQHASLQVDQKLDQRSPHGDRVESGDKGMAVLFWLFAAASVGGALFVVTRKNLIAAVMGMVGSFIGIAAVYMMLYASFLAVLQMLVYAGAIMVLFVFVIMILNRPEDEPVAPTGRAGQVVGGLAILYLVGRLAMILTSVHPPAGDAAVDTAMRKKDDAAAVYDRAVFARDRALAQTLTDLRNAGATIWDPTVWTGIVDSPSVETTETQVEQALTALQVANVDVQRLQGFAQPQNTPEGHQWGSVKAVGTDLFNGGLFPFEAISILLLIAVVGAIAIARPLKDDAAPSEAPGEGGGH